MPRRQQHVESSATAAALVAGVVDLATQDARQRVDPSYRPDLGRTAALTTLAYAIGAEVGTWPDHLEPATTPRHREFFHSWSFLGLLTWGTVRLLQSPVDPAWKWLAGMAATGYAVHLLDDATEKPTSRLPLI
jgi:membrane-bound metal-dependent hydrolase YbcI (DUF457 family)